MANPIKAAQDMFKRFLSKYDPESQPTPSENPQERDAAKARASKGGTARAASLTPEKRRKIAKRAAKKRWQRP